MFLIMANSPQLEFERFRIRKGFVQNETLKKLARHVGLEPTTLNGSNQLS